MPVANSVLPWNFEAFRKFIDYRTLQNAATVICLFEHKNILESPQEMERFEELLRRRTGLEWSPARRASEDINFNTEGNLFRNKGRVLTSFYLIDPLRYKFDNVVVPTKFCKALGAGYIVETEFYKEIIKRFAYPHPAYDENWTAWRSKEATIRPMLFILDILVCLAEKGIDQAYLTKDEFAKYGHANPMQDQAGQIVELILANRAAGGRIERQRSDQIDRKLGDMFGFMCMSPFCYYDRHDIRLNLVAKHPEENVYFVHKRGNQDRLKDIRNYVNESLGR